MSFLRTLFWIVLTVVVVVFSMRNWVPVTINLFGDLRADVKLPVLLLAAFLLGFLPLYLWHRIKLWRHRRALAEAPAAIAPTPVPPMPTASVPLPPEPGIAPARAD